MEDIYNDTDNSEMEGSYLDDEEAKQDDLEGENTNKINLLNMLEDDLEDVQVSGAKNMSIQNKNLSVIPEEKDFSQVRIKNIRTGKYHTHQILDPSHFSLVQTSVIKDNPQNPQENKSVVNKQADNEQKPKPKKNRRSVWNKHWHKQDKCNQDLSDAVQRDDVKAIREMFKEGNQQIPAINSLFLDDYTVLH